MPDSYGMSFTRLRTRLPSRYETVANPPPAPSPAMPAPGRGNTLPCRKSALSFGKRRSKLDYNGCKRGVSTDDGNPRSSSMANRAPCPEGKRCSDCCGSSELDPARVAVELDRRIVKQAQWSETVFGPERRWKSCSSWAAARFTAAAGGEESAQAEQQDGGAGKRPAGRLRRIQRPARYIEGKQAGGAARGIGAGRLKCRSRGAG